MSDLPNKHAHILTEVLKSFPHFQRFRYFLTL